MAKEHIFTTYIRTKTFFKLRLKDLKDYNTVKIYVYELDNLVGKQNHGKTLYRLRDQGEIDFDGNDYRALRPGPVQPNLIEIAKGEKQKVPLSNTHLYMRDQLKNVDLPIDKDQIPVYFNSFLSQRKNDLSPFFSVDAFSNRVHTPVVNLKSDLRRSLTFHGEKVVAIDVKQMQPLILSKILKEVIGSNEFSNTIDSGGDIYLHLKSIMHLKDRKDAKKYLFQLIFSPPDGNDGSNWMRWINHYKSTFEPRNPHGNLKHTNLSWLLQYSEVQVMSEVWKILHEMKIPFLTIHDEILCLPRHSSRVQGVMNDVLQRHFEVFELTTT